MTDQCPVCSLTGKKFRNTAKGNVPMNFYHCSSCDIDYTEHWNDEKRVYSFYKKDNYVFKPNITGKSMKYDEYQGRYDNIVPHLDKNVRLLDIGCGDGTFLKMIKSHVAEAEGTEITTHHVTELRKDGFRIWDSLLHNIKPEKPYDVICLFALLEHVPNVKVFLKDLKSRFIHDNTQVFIEVPNLLDPLANIYDILEYRDFYYRQYHLYYFSEYGLKKLLADIGFDCETMPLLQASLTNHFHWMHNGTGQANTTDMSNVVLPQKLLREKSPAGKDVFDLLNELDDIYREKMLSNGIGDLIFCRAWQQK